MNGDSKNVFPKIMGPWTRANLQKYNMELVKLAYWLRPQGVDILKKQDKSKDLQKQPCVQKVLKTVSTQTDLQCVSIPAERCDVCIGTEPKGMLDQCHQVFIDRKINQDTKMIQTVKATSFEVEIQTPQIKIPTSEAWVQTPGVITETKEVQVQASVSEAVFMKHETEGAIMESQQLEAYTDGAVLIADPSFESLFDTSVTSDTSKEVLFEDATSTEQDLEPLKEGALLQAKLETQTTESSMKEYMHFLFKSFLVFVVLLLISDFVTGLEELLRGNQCIPLCRNECVSFCDKHPESVW